MKKLLILLIVFMFIPGCRTSELPPDARYTMRGVIVSIPDESKKGSEFLIHHESLPEYKNREGKTVGMPEMTMPFYPKDNNLIKGYKKGDAIEFIMEVRWSETPFDSITSIKQIPLTDLNLKHE